MLMTDGGGLAMDDDGRLIQHSSFRICLSRSATNDCLLHASRLLGICSGYVLEGTSSGFGDDGAP